MGKILMNEKGEFSMKGIKIAKVISLEKFKKKKSDKQRKKIIDRIVERAKKMDW